jgi:23S rRNA (uracil1939-C5)-methyltransferase
MRTINETCPYFPTCGGCDFRDKSYAQQLQYKEKFCRNLLARFSVSQFSPIIPSPQTDHYRHKMDFCAGLRGEEILLGMRQKSRSTAVVDIEGCLVFFEVLGSILKIFRKWAKTYSVRPYELYKASGEFRYVSVRHSKSSGKIMVVGVFNLSPGEFAQQSEKFQALANELKKVPEVASIYFGLNNKLSDETLGDDLRLWYGGKYIRERINGIEYLSSPAIFLQSNPLACSGLYESVKKEAAACAGDKDILDMYCGSGGITLQLAGVSSGVIAVDNSSRNIEDARENARLNNIDNIEFICEDAEAYLSGADPGKFSTLILDPPRQGLSKKTLKIVLDCGIPNIIYVSCNPLNMREDLIVLSQYYKVERAIPVDMFPHTRHIELVVRLSKQ